MAVRKAIMTVFRIYDPVESKFVSSGHGMYSRGRSMWSGKAQANNALKNMPQSIRGRLIVKKYILIEAE